MDSKTRLEGIADDFVEDYLLNNPIMIYSLDTFVEDWIADHRKELEENNNMTLEEILSQHLQIRSKDKEIDNEIINAADKVWNAVTSGSFDDEEMPDTTLIAQVESIEDPLIYQLTHLVLRSNKVRIKTMSELEEAELEDPLMPNKWIYHKDTPLENAMNYVLQGYEMFKNEDEREKDDGT
jgi:hypothetical protein